VISVISVVNTLSDNFIRVIITTPKEWKHNASE